MGAIRRHRTLIAWIVMLAVFGNVVAGLFCVTSANPDAIDDPILGASIICAAHGEQTAPEDGTLPAPPTAPCQICVTVAAFALVYALVAITLSLPLPVRSRLTVPPIPALTLAIRLGGLGSRAPPLPA
jgi:hypothetical protein